MSSAEIAVFQLCGNSGFIIASSFTVSGERQCWIIIFFLFLVSFACRILTKLYIWLLHLLEK